MESDGTACPPPPPKPQCNKTLNPKPQTLAYTDQFVLLRNCFWAVFEHCEDCPEVPHLMADVMAAASPSPRLVDFFYASPWLSTCLLLVLLCF